MTVFEESKYAETACALADSNQSERAGAPKSTSFIGRSLTSVCQAAGVGEGEVVRVAADDVIENADAEDDAGLVEPRSALAVLAARGWISAGMVVHEYDRGAVGDNGGLERLARADHRGREGALTDKVHPDQAVL